LKQAHVANRSLYVQKKTQKSRQCDTATGRQSRLQRWGTSTLRGLHNIDKDNPMKLEEAAFGPAPMGQPLDWE